MIQLLMKVTKALLVIVKQVVVRGLLLQGQRGLAVSHCLCLELCNLGPNSCHYMLRIHAGICMSLGNNLRRHSINDMFEGIDLAEFDADLVL